MLFAHVLQNPCDLSAVGVKLRFSVNLQTSKLSSKSSATVPRLINDTWRRGFWN